MLYSYIIEYIYFMIYTSICTHIIHHHLSFSSIRHLHRNTPYQFDYFPWLSRHRTKCTNVVTLAIDKMVVMVRWWHTRCLLLISSHSFILYLFSLCSCGLLFMLLHYYILFCIFRLVWDWGDTDIPSFI